MTSSRYPAALLALVLSSCIGPAPRVAVPAHPRLIPAPPNVECELLGVREPVEGTLNLVFRPPRATILTADGDELYILWPRGFTALDENRGQLMDEGGRRVAANGEAISLGQVSRDSAEGTEADPYVATGVFAGRCYVLAPGG